MQLLATVLTTMLTGAFTLAAVYLKHRLETKTPRPKRPATVSGEPVAIEAERQVASGPPRGTRIIALGALACVTTIPADIVSLAAPEAAVGVGMFLAAGVLFFLILRHAPRSFSNLALFVADAASYLGISCCLALPFVAHLTSFAKDGNGFHFSQGASLVFMLAFVLFALATVVMSVVYLIKYSWRHL